MIIKKHSANNFFTWFSAQVTGSRYAFFVGLAVLLAVITSLLLWQNRVVISPSGNFFSQPTNVTVNRLFPWPYQSVHYTLDGSTPTADSPILKSPLTIEKTAVLQLATFAGNTRVSRVITHPIFIGTNHDLPVISIVTESNNLFDPEYGIYTNFNEEGEEWERPAQLTFFEPNGTIGFQKDIGMRIHGGGSAAYPQKSFRIYAGYLDHTDQINYPLFPDLPYTTFNTFLLRAAGGDWEYAYMRDAVMHELASNITTIDTQAARPSVVYINNQYWGIYYLRERIDQHYLANKYGLSRDKLSIIEILHDVGTKRGQTVTDFGQNDKAAKEYNRLYAMSDRDCRGCPNYSEFAPTMDLENLRDYLLLEIYSGNFDWPFGNVKLWRYEQPTIASDDDYSPIDGRLRWILIDLDVGLGFEKKTEEEVIQSAQNRAFNRLDDERFPFRNLIYSNRFREKFVERATELLNTTLTEQYISQIIDERAASIRSEMPNEVARWKDEKTGMDNQIFQSVEEWEKNVALLKLFTKYRTPDLFEDIVEFYGLPGLTEITFTASPANAGTISVGKINKPAEEHPWQGTFFQDTVNIVTAHPNKGFIFDHWEGDIPAGNKYNDSAHIIFKDQKNITAVFRERKWHEYLFSKN